MVCSSCEKEATQMFHFRAEGQLVNLDPVSHVPTCDLHSLRDRPQCAACTCTETWEVLMDRERAKIAKLRRKAAL
jgi:hypothetical protein